MPLQTYRCFAHQPMKEQPQQPQHPRDTNFNALGPSFRSSGGARRKQWWGEHFPRTGSCVLTQRLHKSIAFGYAGKCNATRERGIPSVPFPGYQLAHWENKGPRLLLGLSTTPRCARGMDCNPKLRSLLPSPFFFLK